MTVLIAVNNNDSDKGDNNSTSSGFFFLVLIIELAAICSIIDRKFALEEIQQFLGWFTLYILPYMSTTYSNTKLNVYFNED
uniref:Uncharacterized protein n=1 Tax=Onchocerca volvulus TaxID=6282 RepID=A0A8R1XYU9_ONCVO